MFVRLKISEEIKMLKEYAVALVLSTATPVVADAQEGAKQAPETKKEVATETNVEKPKSGNQGFGMWGF